MTIGNCPVPPDPAATEMFEMPVPSRERIAVEDFNQAGPEQRLRLLLVEEIVSTWGGSLYARTVSGQGFLFTLTLPRAMGMPVEREDSANL